MRLILVSALVLAGCARDQPPGEDAETRAIRESVEQYYIVMSDRIWGEYQKFFWAGSTLTTVWQPPGEPQPRVIPTTIEDFVAQTHLGPDSQPIFEEQLLDQEIRRRGDVAQVLARYEARFGSEDSVMTWRGVDAMTWLKHDGQWRIAALVFVNEPDSAS